MAGVRIPLRAAPQRFSVSLRGVLYNMRLYWLRPAQCWVLDIADANGTTMACGIPLVTGHNLLEQYDYLGMDIALYVVSDHETDAVPDFTRLGVTSHLIGVF